MKKVLIFAIILALLLLGGAVFAYKYLSAPVNAGDSTLQKVVIKPGSNADQIANQLYELNLIKNPLLFRLQLKLDGLSNVLQSGTFELSPGMDLKQIIAALQVTAAGDLEITVLPGWRREEIADYLAAKTDLDNFDRAQFLELTDGLEGKLAANTWRIQPGTTTAEIVALLEKQFQTDITDEFSDLQAQSGKSWNEILTMASILQREARGLEEMQVVAGLLNKRLEEEMPLGLCATLQYCKGQTSDGKYWNPPLAADKDLVCEYNTYQHTGLPPAPISAVSPTAVEAALTPVESDYYYYIHGDDGQVHYASTLEEHNENIAKYLK